MAYFPNGSAGVCFEEQCGKCIFGDEPCPIALVQVENNYKACNIPEARKILDMLIRNDGTCEMFEEFKEILEVKQRCYNGC